MSPLDRSQHDGVAGVASFARPGSAVRVTTDRLVDLERANEVLRRRDGLMTALAEATKLLLGARDFDAAIPEALGRIGAAAGLHRVKVILTRCPGDAVVGTHELTSEWCAPGLTPQALLGLTEFAAADITPYIERSRLGQFSWETIDEVPVHLRDSFRRVGMKSMGVVPVFVGDDYAGVVAFDDCERAREASMVEIDALAVAARTIGAAIHRQRLERARAEALAIARERATELARANDALSRSTAQLVSYDGLPTFLEAVVDEAIAAAGAVSGAVFLLDAEGVALHLHAMNVHGVTLDIGSDPLCDAYREPVPVEGNRAWAEICTRQVFWMDYATRDPDDWPQSYDWHNALGHRFGVCVPMVCDGAAVGFLGLVYDRSVDVQPTDTRLEVARVLAQQATLALRLTQLAEEARLAAIARERVEAAEQREAAEHERAGELMVMNAALRGSLERLTTFGALDDFLESLVREAVDALGAATGAIYSHDVTTDLLSLRAFLLHGERYRPSSTDSPYARPIPAATVYVWSAALAERGPVWIDIDDPTLALHEGSREFHRRYGHRYSVALPIFHGDHCLGLFALAFDREVSVKPRESRLEICRVLAQQAALAMRLSDLGAHALDAGKREAVAAERNRIAGEIHDSLAQSFTSIAMQSEALTANLRQAASRTERDDLPQDATRRRVLHTMSLIERTARLGLAEARSSVLALRPSDGSDGLVEALRSLAERSDVVGTIDCSFVVSGIERALEPVCETALLRIAQEAVGNAMRHARPKHVALRLAYRDASVALAIEDDGCGLPKRRETLGRGFGISGMAARADAIGGEFALDARDPSGTVVSVVLHDPVDEGAGSSA